MVKVRMMDGGEWTDTGGKGVDFYKEKERESGGRDTRQFRNDEVLLCMVSKNLPTHLPGWANSQSTRETREKRKRKRAGLLDRLNYALSVVCEVPSTLLLPLCRGNGGRTW